MNLSRSQMRIAGVVAFSFAVYFGVMSAAGSNFDVAPFRAAIVVLAGQAILATMNMKFKLPQWLLAFEFFLSASILLLATHAAVEVALVSLVLSFSLLCFFASQTYVKND